MTDEEYMKATKDGSVPMDKDEIAQLLADREEAGKKPKRRTLEERVAALEQAVASLK